MDDRAGYSIPGNYREEVSKWLAAIALIAFFFINEYLLPPVVDLAFCIFEKGLLTSEIVRLVLGALGAFSVYYFLWWLFDRYLWKMKPFSYWHHIRDLNGVWTGEGISSFRETHYWFQLTITQTFSKMACEVKTQSSVSSARLMGLFRSDPLSQTCRLEMFYQNQTRELDQSIDSSWPNEHKGFCVYVVDGESMVGDYFTNSDPQTKGRICIAREERKCSIARKASSYSVRL